MSSRRRGGRGPAPARRIEADPDRALVLGIDTSCASDTIVLAQGDLLVASRAVRRARRQGAALAEAVRGLLRSAGYEPGQLGAVTVALGPGAFTGMRVGIATAQGLASALGIPTYGFSSLIGWATTAPACAIPVGVMLDARRSEVYTALYEVDETGRPHEVDGVRLHRPEAWLQELAERRTPSEAWYGDVSTRAAGVLLVGDGARLYADLAREILGDRARLPTSSAMFPDLGQAALEAVERVEAGEPSEPLRPVYLRDHDAAQQRRATS